MKNISPAGEERQPSTDQVYAGPHAHEDENSAEPCWGRQRALVGFDDDVDADADADDADDADADDDDDGVTPGQVGAPC